MLLPLSTLQHLPAPLSLKKWSIPRLLIAWHVHGNTGASAGVVIIN